MEEYMTVEDKRQDLADYVFANYGEALPSHITNLDITILWEALDRMHMDGIPQRLFDDYEMFFVGMMMAIQEKSDKLEEYHQKIAELRAEKGYRNIDVLANTG